MKANQILTKGEYVYSRRTWIDTLLFYSWIPFFIIFGLLGVAVYNDSASGQRLFAILEFPALMLAVVCRSAYAKREADFIMDYYQIYLPSVQ